MIHHTLFYLQTNQQTCQCVDYIPRLHVVKIGRPVPRGCDHLTSARQPIGRNHHAGMALQLHGRGADAGGVKTLHIRRLKR